MRVFLSFPGAAGILRGDKTSPGWKPPKKVAVTRSPQLLFSRQVGGQAGGCLHPAGNRSLPGEGSIPRPASPEQSLRAGGNE